MLGEVVDALREKRDLDLGRSGVVLAEIERLRHIGDGLRLRAQIGSHVKSCLSLGVVPGRPRRSAYGAAVPDFGTSLG